MRLKSLTTLIFSDTHLSNQFDQKKYDYLRRLISASDCVIVNGDFWDGYEITFSQFIESKWQGLFPLLKEKKTVYIFGNHDRQEWSDSRIQRFSETQADLFTFDLPTIQLRIEHGHRLTPRFNSRIEIIPRNVVLWHVVHLIEDVGLFLIGKNFYSFWRSRNDEMKAWAQQNLREKEFLICGHSHLREFNPAASFINTGFIGHGYGQYLLVENDCLRPVDEVYR